MKQKKDLRILHDSSGSFRVAANLEIESMLIHPQLRGIETIKQKQNEKHEHNVRTPRRQQGCNIGKSN